MLLFLCLTLARQVEIKPDDSFEFAEAVSRGDLYKFKYSTMGPVLVTLTDPSGVTISQEKTRSAALFTKCMADGRIKVSVKNESSEPISLSYKSPDPNKEVLGHLGFVKEIDKVSDLAKLLDRLLEEQSKQLARTKEHQALVKKCQNFTRFMMFFEVVITGVAMYFMHRDFIGMFEKKQVV